MLSNINLKGLSLRTEELDEVGLPEEECCSPEESAQQSSEIQQDMISLEDDLESIDDAVDSVQTINDTVQNSEEVIADPNATEEQIQNQIEVSQEAFAFSIGKLGYSMSEFKKIKINTESSSSKVEKLKLHTEGIVEVAKKIVENIKKFFKKVYDFIANIIKKVVNWIKGLFIKEPPKQPNQEFEKKTKDFLDENSDSYKQLKQDLVSMYTWDMTRQQEKARDVAKQALLSYDKKPESQKTSDNNTSDSNVVKSEEYSIANFLMDYTVQSFNAVNKISSPILFNAGVLNESIAYPKHIFKHIEDQVNNIINLLQQMTLVAENKQDIQEIGFDKHSNYIIPEYDKLFKNINKENKLIIASSLFLSDGSIKYLAADKDGGDDKYNVKYRIYNFLDMKPELLEFTENEKKLRLKELEKYDLERIKFIHNQMRENYKDIIDAKQHSNVAIKNIEKKINEIKGITDRFEKALSNLQEDLAGQMLYFTKNLHHVAANFQTLIQFANRLLSKDAIYLETTVIKEYSTLLNIMIKYYPDMK